MMHGMVSQFIAILSELFPFRQALFPGPHSRCHKEGPIQVVLLQNGSGEIEIGVDDIVESQGNRCGTTLRPGCDGGLGGRGLTFHAAGEQCCSQTKSEQGDFHNTVDTADLKLYANTQIPEQRCPLTRWSVVYSHWGAVNY